MRHFLVLVALTCVYVVAVNSYALDVVVTKGNVDPIAVAIPQFGADGQHADQLSKDVVKLIEKDLVSSGMFKGINRDAYIQKIHGSHTLPQFQDWRYIDAAALVTGSIDYAEGATGFTAEFRLWDVLTQRQIAGKRFSTNLENWRRISHMVADEVYHRMTGELGYFDTRIVYIAESGPMKKRIKRLAIMDQDGANHRFLTDGSDLVLTPRFSPTAQEVIYLSYQDTVPKVFIRNVDTGKEWLVGRFKGMSFAPRFSPDGKKVIMSVSEGGNSEIYTFELHTGRKVKLTNNPAIDTSPSYSPDGKRIAFNSDRGGSQQLYVMKADGSAVKRISFGRGRYGTPVWSPRGDYIAFTKMHKGKFYIGVMHPDGTGERLLTESFLDEGPTWSPNGRIIMFARQTKTFGGSSTWYIHSIDITGRNEKKVITPGQASDPAWSSLL